MSDTDVIAHIRRFGKRDGFNDSSIYPDSELLEWIADAKQDVPVSKLGARADRALAYYSLHLMSQAYGKTSVSGAKMKEKVGDVEVQYASTSSDRNITPEGYYQLYLKLIANPAKIGPIVLNGL